MIFNYKSDFLIQTFSERNSDSKTNIFLAPVVEVQTKSEDNIINILGKVKFGANQPSILLLIDSNLKKK